MPIGVLSDSEGVNDLSKYPVRFVILGDRTGGHTPGIFKQIVIEAERLKPDFVVTVGDMIEGYTEDTTVVVSEWDEYLSLLEPLEMPIYHTAGNHDITYESLEELYRRYVGEPYYSFDHRGLHFTFLDNSRWDSSDQLPDQQLAWLEADLRNHQDATHTFVFMHKPFWYSTTDAVVTGHFHRYFSGKFDGIIYTSLGSSGGSMEDYLIGPGYHFAWVTVDEQEISIAPIKMGAVLPWDETKAYELFTAFSCLNKGLRFVNPATVTDELKVASTTVELTLHNYSESEVLEDTVIWEVPPGWSVNPVGQAVKIPPGEEERLSFRLECTGSLYPLPSILVDFPYAEDKSLTVKKYLHASRELDCPRAVSPPKIDGKLDDKVWQLAATDLLGTEGNLTTIDSTWFYFAHDDESLYLAASCHESKMSSLKADVAERDGAVYSEDCIGYFFQPRIDQDIIYQIYINPAGIVFDQRISPGEDGYFAGDPQWNGTYEIATDRGKNLWIVEARIALEQLGAKADKGKEWGINFRRKQSRLASTGNWQVPIAYDPDTFGRLRMQ
jgi:predicted phosphodiesterase